MKEKIRRFDSQGIDVLPLHRLSNSDPIQGIHAIGNGRIMSYGRGPELMQCFGPNYSSPNMLSLVAVPANAWLPNPIGFPEPISGSMN